MPTGVIALFTTQRESDSQNSGVDEHIEEVCYRNLWTWRCAFHNFKSAWVWRVRFPDLPRWHGVSFDFEIFLR